VSEVFEGIVVSRQPTEIGPIESKLPLRSEPLQNATIIYRSDSRSAAAFAPEIERLAEQLAERLGAATVVRYDSRIGHRSSIAFRRGQPPQSYGPEHELFVPLDDEGEPRSDVEPVTFKERDPSEEYETATNAIEHGLRVIGGPEWSNLRRFIASH
jgi:hypothetical protein